MNTFGLVILKAFIIAFCGASGGVVIAWFYNLVAGLMGGLKIDFESLLQKALIIAGKEIQGV